LGPKIGGLGSGMVLLLSGLNSGTLLYYYCRLSKTNPPDPRHGNHHSGLVLWTQRVHLWPHAGYQCSSLVQVRIRACRSRRGHVL